LPGRIALLSPPPVHRVKVKRLKGLADT